MRILEQKTIFNLISTLEYQASLFNETLRNKNLKSDKKMKIASSAVVKLTVTKIRKLKVRM